jgi:GNAT superfamily N-acetyltransferase
MILSSRSGNLTIGDIHMDRQWSIRHYVEGDEEKIKDLAFKVQELKKSEDDYFKWWKWQHKDCPSGPPIIYFADADGLLAGQYEMVRMRVRHDGKEKEGFHSQDTMTHPDFRRQGIFKELATSTYDKGEEEGCSFVFGFPNEFSHPGFVNKLEFQDVCIIPNVFRPLNMERTLKRRTKNGLIIALGSIAFRIFFSIYGNRKSPPKVEGLDVKKVERFDSRIDDLWKRASGDYKTLVVRDTAHCNWRYVDIPHRDYDIFIAEREGRVAGYIVLSLVEKEDFRGGEIIDIFAEPDEKIIGNLIFKALEHFKDKKADSVYCWYPDMEVYRKAFSMFGFLKMGPNPAMIARKLDQKLEMEKLKDYSNWFVTMGDSDFH